ncbi:MAG TPA: ABC transporter permease [Caldisericia bacterium]|nr:ABC transporter permease [Caldisericia bacterium]HXK51181.1 ABC transporter permease [Caldisericia bacterium]
MRYYSLAVANMKRRKWRTFLTTIGISAIVLAFFSVVTFSEGYQRALKQEFTSLGIQILAVPKGCPYEMTIFVLHGGYIEKSLTMEQFQNVKSHPAVSIASPILIQKFEDPTSHKETVLYGVYPDFAILKPLWDKSELIFSHEEAMECWIGSNLAEVLSLKAGDTLPPIFFKEELTIVGVLPKTRTADDQFIFAPLKTVQKIVNLPDQMKAIGIQLKEGEKVGATIEDLSAIPDVQIVSYRQAEYTLNDLVQSTQNLLQIAIWFIVFIGVIGIMNTIFMAIEDRRREMGMMKALGASSIQLAYGIGIETVCIIVTGSFLGMILAWFLNQGIENLLRSLVSNAPGGTLSYYSLETIFLTLSFCVVIGLASIIIPVVTIQKISPLEAIQDDKS